VENGNWIARADGETDLKADPVAVGKPKF